MSLFTALVLLVLLRLLFGPRAKRSTVLTVSVLLVGLVAYQWLADTPTPGSATDPTSSRPLVRSADQDEAQEQLAQALRDDDLNLIRRSLGAGADARNSGRSDSFLTLARSNEARQLLLTHGASPDGLPAQRPPLLHAWGEDNLPLYQWLLEQGADPQRALDARPEMLVIILFNSDDPAPWLQPLLDRGVDLNRELPGGLSTLDELLLSGLHPDWVERLRSAGAKHALLLDRGVPLPPQHSAMEHVRAWLAAKRQPDWPDPEDRFVLPDLGRHGCDGQQPALPDAALVGRIEGDRALVEVTGPTDYGPSRTMIGLRQLTAEVDTAGPAERPVDGLGTGLWRISGCAEDRRYSGS